MKNLLKILLLTPALLFSNEIANSELKITGPPKSEITVPNFIPDKTSPFTDIYGNTIIADSIYPDTNATIFLEKTLIEAEEMYFQEKFLQEKYKSTREIFQTRRDSLSKEELKEQIKNENEFYKEIKRFGKGILKKDKSDYDKKLPEKLLKLGLTDTDCTTYLLESMSLGNNKNYNLKKYHSTKKITDLLDKLNFEAIYIAENITKRTKEYEYNKIYDIPSYTKDFMEQIKQQSYFAKINYLVTEKNFHNPSFKKFINQTKGFLMFQEAVHMALLSEGEFLECHKSTDPLKSNLYSKTNLITRMNNQIPWANYQSAVLFVPKGTVQNYLREEKIEK